MDIIQVFSVSIVGVVLLANAVVFAMAMAEWAARKWHERQQRDAIDRHIEWRARCDEDDGIVRDWYANNLLVKTSYGPFETKSGGWAFVLAGSDIQDQDYHESNGWYVERRCRFPAKIWPVQEINVKVFEA